MRPAATFHRRGSTSAAVLIVAIVFGVLLMHSVTMTDVHGGDHASTSSPSHSAESAPMMFDDHGHPSGHPMMHPCVGTVMSWPSVSAPNEHIGVVEHGPDVIDHIGLHTTSTLERAPPWTLWELDRSVLLRV